jgi:Uma2 family endonuclease
MLQAEGQLTLPEFLNLPLGEGDATYELIEGQAVPKVSPKKFHSKLTRALLNLIDRWCRDRGEVCPELAIMLTRRGQDWAPVPELLYLSADRFPADWEEDRFPV